MARTPKTLAKSRQSSRSRHLAPANVVFAEEDESEGEDDFRTTKGARERDVNTQSYANEEDISRVLQEHREKRSKKVTSWNTTFQAQNTAIYAAARKDAKALSQIGVQYIESARAGLRNLRIHEVSSENRFQDFQQLVLAQEASINTLLSSYSPLLEHLTPRRSEQVNAASQMLKTNPSRRQTAIKRFSKNALTQVERVRETERAASDASALIKYYKGLLYT